MSLDDRIRLLDERIEALVKQWAEEVHDRVGRSLTEEISRHLETAKSQVAAPAASSEALKTLTEAASSYGGVIILRRLRQALKALDGAGKQADVLHALLEETAPFASRRAIFLARDRQASGWAERGFGEAGARISGLAVDYQTEGPWSRLAQGRASVPLSAGESGRLCSRLEAPLAREGVLIPIVLRDRVAAVLYADRRVEDLAALDVEGLQILAFVAAQSIESLAFRSRTTVSPTLLLEGEEDSSQERLGLWPAAATAAAAGTAAAAVASAVPAEAAKIAEVDDEELTPEEEAAEKAGPEPSYRETQDLAEEVEIEEYEIEEYEIEVDEEPAPDEALGTSDAGDSVFAEDSVSAEDELGEDELAEDELAAAELAVQESSARAAAEGSRREADEAEDSDLELPELDTDEDDRYLLGDIEEPASADLAEEDIEEVRDAALETASWPAEELTDDLPAVDGAPAPSASIPWTDDEDAVAEEPTPVTTEPAALWDAEEDEQEVALDEVEEPPAAPTWEVVDEASPVSTVAPASGLETIHTPTLPATGLDPEEATVLLPRPTGVSSPPTGGREDSDDTHPGTVAPPPTPTPEAGRASEVVPPADVQGPGWAFTKEAQARGEEDEDHKQAKRLARLLVSEIKLYNEEQVEQGQKNRDIYERLREDIDRSRQVYEDRVHERVRSQNDYFYQELVRTLASGDPQALGI
jgi:hypothetical protein